MTPDEQRELNVRPWRDGLDDEIDSEQEYERGLPCAECGEMTYPENYECACPRATRDFTTARILWSLTRLVRRWSLMGVAEHHTASVRAVADPTGPDGAIRGSEGRMTPPKRGQVFICGPITGFRAEWDEAGGTSMTIDRLGPFRSPRKPRIKFRRWGNRA